MRLVEVSVVIGLLFHPIDKVDAWMVEVVVVGEACSLHHC